MSSSSTSNSSLQLVAVVLLALLPLALVDHALYHNRLFLRYFGNATQEGQALAKKDRAPLYARSADVILFGSSFIRSGVSSEPFTASGRLVFNAAVSGGGPLYSYYALEDISATLRERKKKPLLVLELNPDALLKKRREWSEYPQFIALVRDRGRVLQDFPLLFQNYLAYGQASRFLSGLLFPSLIYRESSRRIYQKWSEFQEGRKPMGGYFTGMEDHGGYAPIYTIATREPECEGEGERNAVLPLEGFEPTKVAFLRRFLALAATLDAPVLLIERPNICHDQLLAGLADTLRRDYPSLTYLHSRGFGLATEDFQSSAPKSHPNIWGADKIGERIVRQMGAMESGVAVGGASLFRARWEELYGSNLSLDWKELEPWVSKLPNGALLFTTTAAQVNPGQQGLLASSTEIVVEPGREYILESYSKVGGGILIVAWDSRGGDSKFQEDGSYRLPEESVSEFRHFIRFRPTGGILQIRLHYAVSQRPMIGEFKLLRLVKEVGP